jgi:hypothetical protein
MQHSTYGVNVDSHQWFGILVTFMYVAVLPMLIITAGVWAAQVGSERKTMDSQPIEEPERR